MQMAMGWCRRCWPRGLGLDDHGEDHGHVVAMASVIIIVTMASVDAKDAEAMAAEQRW